jgi:hypothetical protein
MNKSLNKYKKSRWIKIRLSKRHRADIALRAMSATFTTVQSMSLIRSINACMSIDKVGKAIAICDVILDNLKAMQINGE